MKFGLFDHIDRRDEAHGKTYAERLELIEAAEIAGFYGYHLAQRHWAPLGMAPSPSVFLSAVIQRTKAMRLGSMVYLLPLYHPLRLIEDLCMLDPMSGGRLQFGVGRGVSPFVGNAVNLFVAETDSDAEKIATPAFARFQDSLAHLWVKWRARLNFIVNDLAAARKLSTTIIGSPATVREQLEKRCAETGTNYAMLEMAWGTLGQEAEMRSMQLFASEVMQHFTNG